MKSLTTFFAILFFLLAPRNSFAQLNTIFPIEVGKEPSYITGYYDFAAQDYILLIITNGYDANFNGVEDSGDEKPAIYKISFTSELFGSNTVQKIADLPFASIPFPTRVGLDMGKNTIILPDTNLGISFYNITDGSKIKTIYPFSNPEPPYQPLDPSKARVSGISFYNGFLLVSIRAPELEANKFYILEPEQNKIYFETNVDPNPQQAIVQNKKLFILCEGTFGSDNSTLIVYDLKNMAPNDFEIMYNSQLNIGSAGNHLSPLDSNQILITMNGSHEIHILNTQTLEITKTIKLPTTGYDGPRESNVFQNNLILTTAYDGNLYTYHTNGNFVGKKTFDGKLEGLFSIYYEPLNFSVVAVTSPFLQDYSPNNKIFVLVNFSDVPDLIKTQDFQISPNPVSDFCKLILPSDIQSTATVDIFSSNGERIKSFTLNFAGKELLLAVNDLSNGVYFARISGGSRIWTIPFVIAH
jgi:hypothetical protein